MVTPLLPVGRLAAACATLLVLGACATEPKFEVVGASLIEESPDIVVIAVHVNATNPNEDPLPLKFVEYTLSVSGSPEVHVTRSAEATIPAMAVHRLVLPATVPRSVAGALAGGDVSVSGQVEYVSESKLSEVAYDLGFGWSSVRFGGKTVVGTPPPPPVRTATPPIPSAPPPATSPPAANPG